MINKYICRDVFEAVQWTEDNYDEIRKFGGRDVYLDDYGALFVYVERGRIPVQEGDYIIKDDCGILWVCSEVLFNYFFSSLNRSKNEPKK